MKIPRLRKIYALIPEELFQRLKEKGKITDGFDAWLTNVLDKALKEEEGD